jgi:hypothetical protein
MIGKGSGMGVSDPKSALKHTLYTLTGRWQCQTMVKARKAVIEPGRWSKPKAKATETIIAEVTIPFLGHLSDLTQTWASIVKATSGLRLVFSTRLRIYYSSQ